MIKLYPSSAAFVLGDTVVTEYDSGCLRKILLTSKGVRGDIPAVYMRVGAVHEDNYAAGMANMQDVATFLREVPIKAPVPGYETVMYSGRADFIADHRIAVTGKLGGKLIEVIHETKATISKTTRLKVIRKGLVKTNQLAQLVSYMIQRQTPYGILFVGYYEENAEGELVCTESRRFKIFIDDEGAVYIDGMPSGFTAQDQIAHRIAAARVLTEDVIGERPDGWNAPYSGPCVRCPHKMTCILVDTGSISTVTDFVAAAKVDIEQAVKDKKPDPVPNKIKVKKPKAPRKPRKKKGTE